MLLHLVRPAAVARRSVDQRHRPLGARQCRNLRNFRPTPPCRSLRQTLPTQRLPVLDAQDHLRSVERCTDVLHAVPVSYLALGPPLVGGIPGCVGRRKSRRSSGVNPIRRSITWLRTTSMHNAKLRRHICGVQNGGSLITVDSTWVLAVAGALPARRARRGPAGVVLLRLETRGCDVAWPAPRPGSSVVEVGGSLGLRVAPPAVRPRRAGAGDHAAQRARPGTECFPRTCVRGCADPSRRRGKKPSNTSAARPGMPRLSASLRNERPAHRLHLLHSSHRRVACGARCAAARWTPYSPGADATSCAERTVDGATCCATLVGLSEARGAGRQTVDVGRRAAPNRRVTRRPVRS
ncbi:hypothetical protein DER30_0048 [Streptomyces sp. HB202]|nr:hypothetical protein DER30_0048 [Streptomyces sp. HB202]